MKLIITLFCIFTIAAAQLTNTNNDNNQKLEFVTDKPQCNGVTNSGCLYLQGGTIGNATTDNTQDTATCTNFKGNGQKLKTTCQIPYDSQATVKCKKQGSLIQVVFNQQSSSYQLSSTSKPKQIYWASEKGSSSSSTTINPTTTNKQGDNLYITC